MLSLVYDNNRYPLSDQETARLVYKLSGIASGAFPTEVEYVGAGLEWTEDASRLADALYLALHDSCDVSLELDNGQAVALYQALRVTYRGQAPNALTHLYDALKTRFQ